MSDLLLKMPLNYEPLRKNRWVFRFPADLGIQEWWLQSASRPTITQKETEIPFFNMINNEINKNPATTPVLELAKNILINARKAIISNAFL